ncbi:hypothetical protein FJ656_03330 [Schumannella luteola]|uniref:Uncharacterized protein n=1 Tax=Schumannella luteola TaxID=472059 RepID=A0A852YQG0_9MICO|nr:hypothetical protein [Schumannella luteola]NYG99455.1 hypothetical protein [Schumannella luteola]TPX06169.1 hypothetical protein FJ656_03330 [Schumannella luteola]
MTGTKKIRRKLEAGIGAERMVRVERDLRHAGRIDGFVLAVGTEWVLLAATGDGGRPDGVIAVRIRDITGVEWDTSFESRFARTLPSWPPTAPGEPGLDSTSEVLAYLGDHHAPIGIEKETERRALWIGAIESIDRKHVWLDEALPDASWRGPLGYRLKRITSVHAGGRYLAALAVVAGQIPPRLAAR